MNVLRFERWVEDVAGERVVAPCPCPALVAVHGVSGGATVTVERPRRSLSGRQEWVARAELEVAPGVSRLAHIGRGDVSDLPELRLVWSAPVEFVVAVVSQ